MRRRQFLVLSATSIGGVLVYSLDRKVSRLSAQDDKTVRIPLRFFTQAEAYIVAAAASRIFPNDDTGPGAKEAGVAIFIDRQLAGPWGRDRYRYTQAPFDENAHGGIWLSGQGHAATDLPAGVERPRRVSTGCTADQQDQELKQIESSVFFNLLRRNTIEGMFCDPMHGGNADMVGWQMIGFPPARA